MVQPSEAQYKKHYDTYTNKRISWSEGMAEQSYLQAYYHHDYLKLPERYNLNLAQAGDCTEWVRLYKRATFVHMTLHKPFSMPPWVISDKIQMFIAISNKGWENKICGWIHNMRELLKDTKIFNIEPSLTAQWKKELTDLWEGGMKDAKWWEFFQIKQLIISYSGQDDTFVGKC